MTIFSARKKGYFILGRPPLQNLHFSAAPLAFFQITPTSLRTLVIQTF